MSNKLTFNGIALVALSFALAILEFNDGIGSILASPLNMGIVWGSTVANVLIPLIVAALPIGIYKLWKKRLMPFRYLTIWILWFILSLLPSLAGIGA